MSVDSCDSAAGAGGGGAGARGGRRALRWLRGYGRAAAAADAVAGVTLGLTLVPQSIAYAALAGLPAHVGLYSSFIGTIVYAALGSVAEVSIGPTSLMALMTRQALGAQTLPPLPLLALLTLLAGAVVLLMGVLRLGFLVQLISPTVTSGFTSATALVITWSQLPALLGLAAAPAPPWARAPRAADAALGVASCVVLLALRKLKDLPVAGKRLRRALWLVSIARNALVVCGGAALAWALHPPPPADPPFRLAGRVRGGLPTFSLPAFSVPAGAAGAGAEGADFLDMVRALGSSVLLMPLVMVLANSAIAMAFSSGRALQATREMVALGLCNACGACAGAMPVCGAFTRSAVAHASGVRTPLAGLYAGLVSLLALVFLTEYFYFIPRASLAAVLVCAVVFMVDVSIVRRLWRGARAELAPLALTLGAGAAGSVELGVLCGAGASLALLLWAAVGRAPDLDRGKRWTRVSPRVALVYVGCARVRAALLAAPGPALLDLGAVALVDYTACQMIEEVAAALAARGSRLVVMNARGEVRARLAALRGVSPAALAAADPAAALAAADLAAAAAAPSDAGGEGTGLLATQEHSV